MRVANRRPRLAEISTVRFREIGLLMPLSANARFHPSVAVAALTQVTTSRRVVILGCSLHPKFEFFLSTPIHRQDKIV